MMVGFDGSFDGSSVAGFSSLMAVSEPHGNEVDDDDELIGTGQADVSEADFGQNEKMIDEERRQEEDRLEGSQVGASVTRRFRRDPHDDATAEPQQRTTTQMEAGEEQVRQRSACLDLPGCQFEIAFTDHSRTVPECSHYHRDVKLYAACCNVVIECRMCHDELTNGSHFMEQGKSAKVFCKQAQDVGRKCSNPAYAVETVEAYFCAICRLYYSSDTPVYHCDSCGLCRKGIQEEYFHCETCNACVSIESRARHRCMPRSLDVDCPICKEYLFTSTKHVMYMRCGHAMHVQCWDVHTRTKDTCPFCQKSLATMDSD
jgi:hypothetical protein